MTESQWNWVALYTSQLCSNLHKSSEPEMSPFETALGKQPMTTLDVAKFMNQGKYLAAYKVSREKLKIYSEAQERVQKAQRCMKKYVDKHHRSVVFSVGNEIFLKLTPQIWKHIVSKTRNRGLIPKCDGLFEVVKRVGEVACRPNFPESLKICPTLQVTFMKPYILDVDDLGRKRSKRRP